MKSRSIGPTESEMPTGHAKFRHIRWCGIQMTPDKALTLLSFSVSYAPTLHGERPARRGDWGRPPWPTGCAVRMQLDATISSLG